MGRRHHLASMDRHNQRLSRMCRRHHHHLASMGRRHLRLFPRRRGIGQQLLQGIAASHLGVDGHPGRPHPLGDGRGIAVERGAVGSRQDVD